MVQQDITLTGHNLKLSILKPEHFSLLEPLANDKNIWEFNPIFNDPAEFKAKWFDKAMTQITTGKRIPFYIEFKGQPVGSSSYYDIDLENKKINIGYTWFNPKFWGTGVNKIAKYLMYKYAFETLQVENVHIQADSTHQRLLARLEKIGAKQTRIIENHLIVPEGKLRTTVVYSVNKIDWPQVKTKLEAELKELA